MKVIQINGIRGLLVGIFIVSCLIAGFVFFPAMVVMKLWNTYLAGFPVLNLFQGVLLWGIFVTSYCIIFSKKGLAVSFKEISGLNDKELDRVMEKARAHAQVIKAANLFAKTKQLKEEESQVSDKKELESNKKN